MAAIAPERQMRLCEACGGVDDHPRHVVSTRPGESAVLGADLLRTAINAGLGDAGMAEALDNSTTVLHMDCCAQRGCPDGTCKAILASASGKTGPELLEHITDGGVDHIGTQRGAAVESLGGDDETKG